MKLIKRLIIFGLLHLSFLFVGIVLVVIAVAIFVAGDSEEENSKQKKHMSMVINNQIYSDTYISLLNQYLVSDGYVSLERLVYYLQITNDTLDTSQLSYKTWEDAYLSNVDKNVKNMTSIREICAKFIDKETTIESGTNQNGIYIEVLNLCDNIDETIGNNYLPYHFPIHGSFFITSSIYEIRDLDMGKNSSDPHTGWDIGVSVGTDFYSICDGEITNITNTQNNDLPYKQSHNDIGNYMTIKCDNNLYASYLHIQYKSQPKNLQVGSKVKKDDLIGKTSTTGTSTGPHLHLGLRDENGNVLDAFSYIDFSSIRKTS